MVNKSERMRAVLNGEAVDRVPFVPSIYEHGARLLGRKPGEVSRDARLMAAAALKAYSTYSHDLVTVGVDIYNIEAEAFGCAISSGGEGSIPGVESRPLAETEELNPASLEIPTATTTNRLGLIAEAVDEVVEKIGNEVWVYGCMGGPFSQAVELRSFDKLICDMYEAPERVHALLEKTTELSLQQARRLSKRGAGVYLYESWATIPLIDPTIFETFVIPYNERVVKAIREEFDTPPPSVIMGGDTAILVNYFLRMRASLMAADFNTDFNLMRAKTEGREMIIRGCVDPKVIERGGWDELGQSIKGLSEKSEGMKNFVWGCGCVSLNTPESHVLRFKDMCANA